MSHRSFYSLALSLICFTTTSLLSNEITPSSPESCPDGKKHYRVSVRHIESGGIGYSEGYTTLEGFFAPDPLRLSWMPFLDVRGHVFNDGKMAANAGLGVRKIGERRTYGLNAYYDYRNTSKLHYNQIGVGLETLGILWDFRINGYLPVGEKITAPYSVKFDKFSGHSMLLSQKRQFAMKGGDAEIGFHFGKSRHFDFYGAAGPYYFIGEVGPNTWGGKARIAGMYKEYITLEISDSYDRMFHNNFQGQLTFTLALGDRSRMKKTKSYNSCKMADAIIARMVQPVGREEIIVVGKTHQTTTAIDPATGEPYFFVFVANTSNSSGTYESPYPTFALAEINSGPSDIIYVFPGDGTTTGMDAGIALQNHQYLLGAGISQSIPTSEGVVVIPAQSSSSPTITNSDVDTEGNAITLAANNVVRGFRITSPLNDAILGIGSQTLEVSSCIFENTTTFPIEATFPGDASVSVTNNQFLNNTNGVFLSLNGSSTVNCSENMFTGQTSPSSVPIEISAVSNIISVNIENNVITNNYTGGIRFGLNTVIDANITVLNNTLANNQTGAGAALGSSFVVLTTGTTDKCTIVAKNNSFTNITGIGSNALYLHTDGAFTSLEITASTNTVSNIGGAALVLATPVDTLTLLATDNIFTECSDNGISVISSGTSSAGNITINNNTITNISNGSNAIAINQDFSALNLTILNNEINGCDGTGVLSFPPTGIDSLTMNISNNTMSNCLNTSSNAASSISFDNYVSLTATVKNNTLSNNVNPSLAIGTFTSGNPDVCLTLSGNSCDTDPAYVLTNPVGGVFNLSPCNTESVNVGTINQSGMITPVQSCANPTPCPI